MRESLASPGARHDVRFAYFMVRVAYQGAAPSLAGTVERLGTGEKKGFDGADELVRLIHQRPPVSLHARAAEDRGSSSQETGR